MAIITSPSTWLNGTPALPAWFQQVQNFVNNSNAGLVSYKSLIVDGVGGQTVAPASGSLTTSGALTVQGGGATITGNSSIAGNLSIGSSGAISWSTPIVRNVWMNACTFGNGIGWTNGANGSISATAGSTFAFAPFINHWATSPTPLVTLTQVQMRIKPANTVVMQFSVMQQTPLNNAGTPVSLFNLGSVNSAGSATDQLLTISGLSANLDSSSTLYIQCTSGQTGDLWYAANFTFNLAAI